MPPTREIGANCLNAVFGALASLIAIKTAALVMGDLAALVDRRIYCPMIHQVA